MMAKIVERRGTHFTVQVTIAYQSSMLDFEESIQEGVNQVGLVATEEALSQFDTDGSAIVVGTSKLTSKGKESKRYQTPYGAVSIERHVYQSTKGGKTYSPLDHRARIIISSTPKFAKMVSSKYAELGSSRVQADLNQNHGRTVARCYIQDISEAVSAVVLAKEEAWEYALPEMPVESVSIGMDGTCMLLCNDSYREAIVGTISLYNKKRDRVHTIYMGAPPEYGKEIFLQRMEREIAHVKSLYPNARYVGVADGAEVNWTFLKPHISREILDFYHASGYIKDAANAAHPRSEKQSHLWFIEQRHELKHTRGAAKNILEKMKEFTLKKLNKTKLKKLNAAITYFTNHAHQMNYVQYLKDKLPIGSGVTEAACKTLIKQRLCCSGMKWTARGSGVVLSLRALVLTKGRWEQFWNKLDRHGIPAVAYILSTSSYNHTLIRPLLKMARLDVHPVKI